MSSPIAEFVSVPPYIEKLQELLIQQNSNSVDWLVIAHDDSRMIRNLTNAFAESSAAMVQMPQSSWDFGKDEFATTIEQSVRQASIAHIVLVGHSEGVLSSETIRFFKNFPRRTNAGPGSLDATYNRLLNRAKQAQNGLQRAKNHFAQQFDHLSKIPGVKNRLLNNELQLHGLLYIAESGVFLCYDTINKKFVPLTTTF